MPGHRYLSALFLLLLTSQCLLAADAKDHGLVSRYEGSKVQTHSHEAFGEYRLIKGLDAEQNPVSEPLQGKVTRFRYQNPKGRSTLEISSNYRQALLAQGMRVVFECSGEQCVRRGAGPGSWQRLNGLFLHGGKDHRYFAGQISRGDLNAWVAVMVLPDRSYLDIVELAEMQTGMVVADAAALARGLEMEGRMRVDGILFDTDRATLKPESDAAIAEVAGLLKSRPDLKLFVVGHTDLSGALAHNLQLSAARAEAVATALVSAHGIARDRLESHGVGPLAPVASNAHEAGRALNRRVEIVAR